MKYIYMIGISESGGMWNCTGKAFSNYAKAEAARDKCRATEGAKPFSRLFTIEVDESEPTPEAFASQQGLT
jgi:hypothetical protein